MLINKKLTKINFVQCLRGLPAMRPDVRQQMTRLRQRLRRGPDSGIYAMLRQAKDGVQTTDGNSFAETTAPVLRFAHHLTKHLTFCLFVFFPYLAFGSFASKPIFFRGFAGGAIKALMASKTTLNYSRSTGSITTSLKFWRWLSAGCCSLSRSMISQPRPAS